MQCDHPTPKQEDAADENVFMSQTKSEKDLLQSSAKMKC